MGPQLLFVIPSTCGFLDVFGLLVMAKLCDPRCFGVYDTNVVSPSSMVLSLCNASLKLVKVLSTMQIREETLELLGIKRQERISKLKRVGRKPKIIWLWVKIRYLKGPLG